MKRLFIAINLPQAVRFAIEAVTAELESKNSGIRFLDPQTWHFTLVFLGDQPDDTLPKIKEAMRETGETFKAPTIRVRELVYGPERKEPRMIWLAGSQDASERLNEIKQFLIASLKMKNIRLESDNRPFSAHITLARLKEITENELPDLEIYRPDFADMDFSALSIELMESHLAPHGASYDLIEKVDFKGFN